MDISYTGGVGNVKAFPLYGRVGVECHVQFVTGWHNRVWKPTAAQPSQLPGAHVVAVEDFQTVICTLHVRFQLKVIERLYAQISSDNTSNHHHNSNLIPTEVRTDCIDSLQLGVKAGMAHVWWQANLCDDAL